MMADIRMLQEQTQQLQNLIGAVSEALKTVNGRLDQQTEVEPQGVRGSEVDHRHARGRPARRP